MRYSQVFGMLLVDLPVDSYTHPDLQNGQQINLAKLIYKFHKPDTTDKGWRQAVQKSDRYYNFHLPSFFFRQALWGLWGNTNKFKFPPKASPVYPLQNGINSDVFSILAGVPQIKNGEQ